MRFVQLNSVNWRGHHASSFRVLADTQLFDVVGKRHWFRRITRTICSRSEFCQKSCDPQACSKTDESAADNQLNIPIEERETSVSDKVQSRQ